MSLFDWLKRLLGAQEDRHRPAAPGSRRAEPAPAIPQRPARKRQPPPLPESTKLELDVEQFAPLSDHDVRKQAKSLGSSWSSPFFGRRDRIPPATDPRTLLIDRAMVAQGLIAPEELAEIHDVGRQMDALRPDLSMAAHLANQAIARTEQERQELKQRKKAEAAERQRKHQEAVALRRRTDIIHLGRGVSAGLADRRSDIEKLKKAGLPILATPADVAQALNLTISRLRWLAFHAEATVVTHYVYFTIPKRSGGARQLAAPHDSLADAQQWILKNILEKVPTHDAAHGFVPGRSTVTNAAPHVGRAIIVNADLKDFFPTVTFNRVAGIFRQLGYSPAVATILGLLCTESPRRVVKYDGQPLYVATGPRALPQGACTSPALSNLVARKMDSRLLGIAAKLGWTYTRYADDLAFSADAEAAKLAGYLLARLRHIAEDEGFKVNEDKVHIQRPHMAQKVTGIIVNQRPGVDRQLVRRLRAILHQARKTGLPAQNREKLPHFEAWLRGMIHYIHMVNPDQARPLYEALANVAS